MLAMHAKNEAMNGMMSNPTVMISNSYKTAPRISISKIIRGKNKY
jgi:hypothetical protein